MLATPSAPWGCLDAGTPLRVAIPPSAALSCGMCLPRGRSSQPVTVGVGGTHALLAPPCSQWAATRPRPPGGCFEAEAVRAVTAVTAALATPAPLSLSPESWRLRPGCAAVAGRPGHPGHPWRSRGPRSPCNSWSGAGPAAAAAAAAALLRRN